MNNMRGGQFQIMEECTNNVVWRSVDGQKNMSEEVGVASGRNRTKFCGMAVSKRLGFLKR